MTIAIGILCDEGAVLVTDSLLLEKTAEGTQLHFQGPAERFHRGEGFIALHSGNRPDVAMPELPPAETWPASAARLLADLDGYACPYPDNPRRFYQCLIAAANPQPSSGVRMLHLSNVGEGRWLSEPGIAIDGAPYQWAMERGWAAVKPPPDIEAASALGVRIAAEFISSVYGGRSLATYLGDQIVPPVAPPIHAIAVTSKGERTLVSSNRLNINAAIGTPG